jgi:hypothetical protein
MEGYREVKESSHSLVGKDGTVYDCNTKKFLSPELPFIDGDALVCLERGKNGPYIARKVCWLVADAFLDNPHNFPLLKHINGNKLDNRVENLMYVDVDPEFPDATDGTSRYLFPRYIESGPDDDWDKTAYMDPETNYHGTPIDYINRFESTKEICEERRKILEEYYIPALIDVISDYISVIDTTKDEKDSFHFDFGYLVSDEIIHEI